VILLLLAALLPQTRISVRHPRSAAPPPLRVVVADNIGRVANCVFSVEEIAERAPVGTPTRKEFHHGDALWARCFLPAPIGKNQARELVDMIFVDGTPTPTPQAYEEALPATAVSRLVAYSMVLRNFLAALTPGTHRIRIEGRLRGKRLYQGELTYVR
jgi:hypothetical protein